MAERRRGPFGSARSRARLRERKGRVRDRPGRERSRSCRGRRWTTHAEVAVAIQGGGDVAGGVAFVEEGGIVEDIAALEEEADVLVEAEAAAEIDLDIVALVAAERGGEGRIVLPDGAGAEAEAAVAPADGAAETLCGVTPGKYWLA